MAQPPGVILEALPRFLDTREARFVKRNVQRGDGLVRTRAFLEVIVEITAALDEAAEQTRHEKRVVTDVFAHRAFSEYARLLVGPQLCEGHLDHAGQTPPLRVPKLKQSVGTAEIVQHRRDVFRDLRVAAPKLIELFARQREQESLGPGG